MQNVPKSTKICIVIIIILLGTAIYAYTNNIVALYDTAYADGKAAGIAEKQTEMYDKTRMYEATNNGLVDQIEAYENLLCFYLDNAVFVTEYGEKYHRYNCYHIRNSDKVWIHNVEYAQVEGFGACSHCFGKSAEDYLMEVTE